MDTRLRKPTRTTPEPETDAVVLELDEIVALSEKKKQKLWIWKTCVVIPENSSDGSVVIGIKQLAKIHPTLRKSEREGLLYRRLAPLPSP